MMAAALFSPKLPSTTPNLNLSTGARPLGTAGRSGKVLLGNGTRWVFSHSVKYAARARRRGGVRCSAAEVRGVVEKGQGVGYLVSESGWGVRRMVEEMDEMVKVAYVQAEAFHEPVALFDDFFFKFFQAEVLSALMYRLKYSPPNRYACLVAEPNDASNVICTSLHGVVGVVDVTVQRDDDVLKHIGVREEYLFVSGIAVLKDFRRKKVASALLKACEALAPLWGLSYLALRAYEDDFGAQKLYSNAGYEVVSGDPKWMTTWIGRRRRVLMVKRSN